MQVQERQTYSPEEYLEREEAAVDKHEYHKGLIIPMTGGTTDHNQIAGNYYTALSVSLKGQPYRVFFGDVRLWIPREQLYTYPDIMVVAGQPVYHANRKDTITNPQVIIEVLSKSTRDYDRGGKFLAYRTIPEFQEYILIDQYSVNVERYVKTANKQWLLTELDGEDSVLSLSTVAFEMAIADLYDQVDFTPEE